MLLVCLSKQLYISDDHGRDRGRGRDHPSRGPYATGFLPRPTTGAHAPSNSCALRVIRAAHVLLVCSHSRDARWLHAVGGPL